jgi:hypothetical protein
MPIRPIGNSWPAATNNEDTQQSSIQPDTSKGVAEICDSFEPHNEFGGPLIGTLIGSAIGEFANNTNETQASDSRPSRAQLQSKNANDEAIEAAKKQKELISNEKEPRRQTHLLKLSKPDPD